MNAIISESCSAVVSSKNNRVLLPSPRILERLEIHYTPKHGSWLNIAESEFSVLQRQCLDRRIQDMDTLRREIQAWQDVRNAGKVGADWHFTTEDARIKLGKLYPSN